jgi:hypothetical protein
MIRQLLAIVRRLWRTVFNRYTATAGLCLVSALVHLRFRSVAGWGYVSLSGIGVVLAIIYVAVLAAGLVARDQRDHAHWRGLRLVERSAMLFVWLFVVFSGWWFANCVLDRSEPRDRASEIVEIVDADLNIGARVSVSWGALKSWERPGETVRLPLDFWERDRLWPGLAVLVKVHDGAFGVPWVSRISRDEERYAVTVLQLSPTASTPWRSLITAHLEHHRWDQAARAADEYFIYYPRAYDFATYVGGTLVSVGRFALGIPYLERVVAARPDYTSYQLLGSALSHSGQLDRGIEILRASIPLKPDDYEAYYHLAFSYLTAGRTEEARSMLEKTLQLRPNFPEVEAELAKLRRRQPDNQGPRANL